MHISIDWIVLCFFLKDPCRPVGMKDNITLNLGKPYIIHKTNTHKTKRISSGDHVLFIWSSCFADLEALNVEPVHKAKLTESQEVHLYGSGEFRNIPFAENNFTLCARQF